MTRYSRAGLAFLVLFAPSFKTLSWPWIFVVAVGLAALLLD